MSTPTQHKIGHKIPKVFLSATMVRILCRFSANFPAQYLEVCTTVKYRFSGRGAQWGAQGGCKFGPLHRPTNGGRGTLKGRMKIKKMHPAQWPLFDAAARCQSVRRRMLSAVGCFPPCDQEAWWLRFDWQHPGANSAKLPPQVENSAQSLQKVCRVEQVSSPVLKTSSDKVFGQNVGASGRAGGLPGLGGFPVWLLWSRVQDEGEAEAAPVLKPWLHQACRSCGWRHLNQHYLLPERDLMELCKLKII